MVLPEEFLTLQDIPTLRVEILLPFMKFDLRERFVARRKHLDDLVQFVLLRQVRSRSAKFQYFYGQSECGSGRAQLRVFLFFSAFQDGPDIAIAKLLTRLNVSSLSPIIPRRDLKDRGTAIQSLFQSLLESHTSAIVDFTVTRVNPGLCVDILKSRESDRN